MTTSTLVELAATPASCAGLSRAFWMRYFIGIGLFVAGVGTGMGIQWWCVHKYEFIPKRWGVVVPEKIYRSGQLTPGVLAKQIEEHEISAIADFQLYDIRDPIQQAEIEYAKEIGIEHHRFPLAGDGTGDIDSYVGAIALMVECQRQGKPLLVHCAAGTQRTGGVVACYRLLIEKADPNDVYAELQDFDWDPGDDQDLSNFLNENLEGIAHQLVQRQIIDQAPHPIPQLAD